MDAQKIAEAASTIKKVENAETWFRMINDNCSNPVDPEKAVVIDTYGNCKSWIGHGEVTPYLRKAMNVYRDEILKYARELAQADKREAENTIRVEVNI